MDDDGMTLSPEQLEAALAEHVSVRFRAVQGRTNHLEAAIAVPVTWDDHEPFVYLTRRVMSLQHGGELCFPGGKPDPTDTSLYATACRELTEELGARASAHLGRLSSVPVYTSDYRLEPFVVRLEPGHLTPNPDEVSEVHRLSLIAALRASSTMAIAYQRGDHEGLSPIYAVGDIWLYGASAHVFRELCVVAARAMGQGAPPLIAGDVSWRDVFTAARGDNASPRPRAAQTVDN